MAWPAARTPSSCCPDRRRWQHADPRPSTSTAARLDPVLSGGRLRSRRPSRRTVRRWSYLVGPTRGARTPTWRRWTGPGRRCSRQRRTRDLPVLAPPGRRARRQRVRHGLPERVGRERPGCSSVGEDGELTGCGTRLPDVTGAPTWTDDGTIVISMTERGRVRATGPLGGCRRTAMTRRSSQPATRHLGQPHPDWSEAGLLYLGSRDRERRTATCTSLDGEDDRELTTRATSKSPTWSPDGEPDRVPRVGRRRTAARSGSRTPSRARRPTSSRSTARSGPPAWGSR